MMDKKEMMAGLMDFVMASYRMMSRVIDAMKEKDGEDKALEIIYECMTDNSLGNCDLNCLCIDDYDEENIIYDMEEVFKILSSLDGDDLLYNIGRLKVCGAFMHDILWTIGINASEWWLDD